MNFPGKTWDVGPCWGLIFLFPIVLGCGRDDLDEDIEDWSALTSVASVREPGVIPRDLTAAQLADILDVEAWTWTFRGPAPECWIEIEEEGQETMPPRIPESGGVGAEIDPFANDLREGTILFYWRRLEPGGAGVLHLSVEGRGVYNLSLGENEFLFGWRGWGARFDLPPGTAGPPIEGEPGDERLLLTYEALQVPEGGGQIGEGTSKITIRLKTRFPDPAENSKSEPDPEPPTPTQTTDKDST